MFRNGLQRSGRKCIFNIRKKMNSNRYWNSLIVLWTFPKQIFSLNRGKLIKNCRLIRINYYSDIAELPIQSLRTGLMFQIQREKEQWPISPYFFSTDSPMQDSCSLSPQDWPWFSAWWMSSISPMPLSTCLAHIYPIPFSGSRTASGFPSSSAPYFYSWSVPW